MRLANVLTLRAIVVALAVPARAGAIDPFDASGRAVRCFWQSNVDRSSPWILSEPNKGATAWIVMAFLMSVMAIVSSVVAWRRSVRLKREKERMEVARRVAAGLLHEVRQPLQVVTSHLELLMLEAADDETKASVEKAYEGVRRIVELFQRLETLHGRGDMRATQVSAHDHTRDVAGEPR